MPVTWNPSDASVNITLSNGNLRATSSNVTQGGVRATASKASGKYYFEGTYSPGAAGVGTGIGWANATAALGAFFGIDKNGVAAFSATPPGSVLFNNASLGAAGGVATTGAVVCIAFDITNQLIWARIGGYGWNNSATANPATGTGGYSVSTINAGPYFPCFCANSSGQSIGVNFGATNFLFPVPSGFSGVDTPATGFTNFAASTKFESLGILNTSPKSAGSTKFEGVAVLNTPPVTVSASKFEGLIVLNNIPVTGGSTKFLGYAIVRLPASVLSESGSLSDIISASFRGSEAIAEAGSLADTISAALIPGQKIIEAGMLADIYSAAYVPAPRPLWMTLDADSGDSIYPN